MTIRCHVLVACAVALAAASYAPTAPARNFSPHLDTTGRGAFDQYNDAVLCNAVLEREIETVPDSGRRPHLEKGVHYTRNFALFMLESGNVVDVAGAILTSGNLPVDRQKAYADWQSIFDALEQEGETPDDEIARCLRIYGHDWE